MSRHFNETAPTDRSNFRHAVFTESVRESLATLELAFRQTPVGLTQQRRTELKFVRAYSDLLNRETARREATGDITSDWAFRAGYHVSYLTNVLLHGTAVWGRLSHSGAYAYRRFRYDDLTKPDALDSVFNDVDTEALAFARTSIAFVPSIHMYSVEGIVELMANGVHILGLYLNKPSTVQDMRHDAFHAVGLLRALMSIDSYEAPIDTAREARFATSRTYALFKQRLSTMVERLKMMPDEKRHAGFAGLFFMLHEVPRTYASVFTEPKIDDLKLQVALLDMKYRIIPQISNPEDIGHGFPERALVWTRTVAKPERHASLAYEALREASFGL